MSHRHTTSSSILNSKSSVASFIADLNVFRGGHTKHATASYRRDNIPELDSLVDPAINTFTNGHIDIPGAQDAKSWTLSLPISLPSGLDNPILDSIIYNISYASFGAGNAFFQTDIVLSNGVDAPEGIITQPAQLAVYSSYDDEETRRSEGYAPPLFNEAIGSCLHSRPSFKGPDISGWCHYVDHQEMYPDVWIGGNEDDMSSVGGGGYLGPDSWRLYLFFHVHENCRAKALRNIDVGVAATWRNGTDEERDQTTTKKEIDEIRKERRMLVVAKREAELMIRRLEETTRKANEESEKRRKGKEVNKLQVLKEQEEEYFGIERRAVAEYEKKIKELSGRDAESRAKRDHATRVGAENAILKVHVEVQKFRDEVEHYRQEEADIRHRMEAERNVRENEYARRVEADKERMRELVEIQKQVHDEIERYRREEAQNRERMEAERKAWEEENARRAEVDKNRMREFIEIQKKLHEELEQYKSVGAGGNGQTRARSREKPKDSEKDKEEHRKSRKEAKRKRKEELVAHGTKEERALQGESRQPKGQQSTTENESTWSDFSSIPAPNPMVMQKILQWVDHTEHSPLVNPFCPPSPPPEL